MAAISSVAFASLEYRRSPPPTAAAARSSPVVGGVQFRAPKLTSRFVVRCASASTYLPPTVSETKLNFVTSYKRLIPSIYNTVLLELLVQQHLIRYKKTYQYDPVFALGFVTVYDQLMEGYPSNDDRAAIFKAYIEALKEDPEQYRVLLGYASTSVKPLQQECTIFEGKGGTLLHYFVQNRSDAEKLETWARAQNVNTIIGFTSREGEVEDILKDISERAKGKGNFSYSRFFAVGLFRLLELANAMEPTILEKLCAELNINKRSVDRDLDVYRNQLSKLVQAKELLKEYVEREKKKVQERVGTQKASEAVTKCLGDSQYARH